MMEYVEFKNKIADSIKDYLPAEYKDFELRFCTVTKSDFEYEALMIEESGQPGAVPALNITEAYKKYIDGSELEDILDEQKLRQLMTDDDREAIDNAYNDAAEQTVWERITHTNHKDVTYYKGLLEEYTRELLLCTRCDFLEEATGEEITGKAF